MKDTLLFFLAPTVMCLILTGIHCYFGIHVLARGVIFVDLALAQVAALGTTVAMLLQYEHGDQGAYFISLGATFVAALFFALTGRVREKLSQEAMIGIVYAFASAAVVLLVDRLSHGTEHIKHALVGQILWVSWFDVIKVATIYGIVSAVLFLFRDEFTRASFQKKHRWIWDFFFYALFGVIITSSVQVAGVLLVFAFLIVPAVVTSYFFHNWRSRLLYGWLVGFLLTVIGMALSYYWDVPSGALIVVLFTLVPICAVLALSLRKPSFSTGG